MTAELDYLTPEQTRSADRFARVLPLAFVTYSLAFLDRNNFGYAGDGMKASLHLSDTMSSLLPALFFPGYFLLQIPAANYASRRSVRWLVFWALILWGLLSSLLGVLSSVPLLVVDRLLLGAVEGVVLPAMLVFLTRWFTRREKSRANSLLMLANPVTMTYASAASGFIIEYFDRHRLLHLKGWQWMFIVEGMPSVLWAAVWILFAKDRPAEAKWLAPSEAQAVQNKLDAEQSGIPQMRNFWQAFGDVRVILLSLMFVFFSIASYALMFWLPKIVRLGSGAAIGRAGLLTAIPYMIACFTIVAVSWVSDRTLKRKPVIIATQLVGALAWGVAALAGPQHFAIAFGALLVVGTTTFAPTSPLWAWMAEMLPRNVVGESMALVNSFGALGGFLGSFIGGWLFEHYKRPEPTFVLCCASLLASAMLTGAVKHRTRSATSPSSLSAAVPSLPPEPAGSASR